MFPCQNFMKKYLALTSYGVTPVVQHSRRMRQGDVKVKPTWATYETISKKIKEKKF